MNVWGDDGDGNEANGDAGDVINLDGGSVGGFVNGEGGADIVNLTGTTVSGNLFGGGGGDTFNVTGGSTSGIRGESGSDVAIWSGGIITTDIVMGTGTDRLDIIGPNFGGSANQSALTLLDGGDNASSADGQVDTLNLIGVRHPVAGPALLAPVQNWERIFVLSNARLTLGNASRTIDGELFNIDASSIVFATGPATFTFGGRLENLGVLDLRDGAANSILDAAGQYFGGAGSTLFVNAELGAPGSDADELRAASTAGNTGIGVVDVLGGAGAYNPDGIVVVRTDAGGSDAAHFALNGGPIDKGLFVYDLLFADSTLTNVVVAGVAEDQHVLAGVPDIEAFQLGRIPAQAQWAWARSTGVWRDRTADLREYVSGSEGLVKAKLQPGAWGRVYGANAERDDTATFALLNKTFTYDTSYDIGVRGITAGGDWVEDGVLDGTALFGAFVGYVSIDADFDEAGGAPSQPTVMGNGISVGGYATYLAGGLFVDALIKADFPELKLSFGSLAPFAASDTVDARTVGGVLDVGYRSFYWRGFYAEFLGTVSYASTRIDDALLGGSVVDFGSNDSLRGRLGAGLGGQIYEFKGHAISARVEGSAWHEFDADNRTDILSLGPAFTVNDDAGGTYGEFSGVLNAFDMSGGPTSFLKFDYRFNDDMRDLGLSVGVRVPLGG
jgi:outer membrane autotransporter protein